MKSLFSAVFTFCLIIFVGSLMMGCTTVHKNQDGTFEVPRATAVRGPLGTNYMTGKLERCNAPAERGWAEPFYTDPESYTNCHDILSWQAFSSTGQGFQVIEGALIGTGIGVAGTLMGGASASSSASQSVTVAPAAAGKGK